MLFIVEKLSDFPGVYDFCVGIISELFHFEMKYDFMSQHHLAEDNQTRYLLLAPAKSGAGISLLKNFTDDTRRVCAFFVSCVRLRFNGGPGGGIERCAGVSEAGKANPVRFHHP